MERNQHEHRNSGHMKSSSCIDSTLQSYNPASGTSNNISVAESDTMQESSGGSTQDQASLFDGSEKFEDEHHSITSATENKKSCSPATDEFHSNFREACDANEILTGCEHKSDSENRVTSFSDITNNPELHQIQNPNDDTSMGEDAAVDFGTVTDAVHQLRTNSGTKSTKSLGLPSQLRRSSKGRDHLITPNDLLSMRLPSAKSFNSGIEERQLSENDSTWNSHRHVDADCISIETNIGDEIPDDLDAEEDLEEATIVPHVLTESIVEPCIEENESKCDSEYDIQNSNNELVMDETKLRDIKQSSEDSLSISSSCSSQNDTYLTSNSGAQSNSTIANIDPADGITVWNQAVNQSTLLEEVNDSKSAESIDNIEDIDVLSELKESIDAGDVQESSESSSSERENQNSNMNTNIEDSTRRTNQTEESFETVYLTNNSRQEQKLAAKLKNPESFSNNLMMEVTSQGRQQRRSSTNFRNASVSRISVQSLDTDNEVLSLDSQIGTQSTEDHGQENQYDERMQLPADLGVGRPPSNRPRRLSIQSSRAVLLDPIMEPVFVSRIPPPSATVPPEEFQTTTTRGAENLLLGAPSTGQLYSPSPLRSAPSVRDRNDTSSLTESLTTSLDELSMLRLHGTLGEPSNRRPMSIIYGHRPVSTRRNSGHRPGSTLNSRPRSTNVCRAPSGRHSWPAMKRPAADVHHLPPSGPDCLPGCGYSGLPCYVCSSKRVQEQTKLRESSSLRHFGLDFPIWTIFRYGSHRGSRVDPFPVPVLHQPRRGRDRNRNGGPPPSYTSLFPETTCFGLRTCCEKCRHSRLTTMILVVLLVVSVIYVLIVAGHFERRM